jgi:hypothetical protein
MKINPILTFLADLSVGIWLLLILWRRDVRKTLPWFVLYVSWEVMTAAAGLVLWLIDRRLYVTVFWWLEAVRLGLIVGAVRESFVQTFVGFSSLRWFPWVVKSVIGCVLAYSILKAVYAPPIQSSLVISVIIAGEFAFRWGIAAIGLLSVAMVWFLELPNDTREALVLDGCAIASTAFLVNVLSRSFFGEKYTWFMQYVPDVGYLLAVAIWIKYMRRPEQKLGFKEVGITPEAMALELQRYRELAARVLKSTNERAQ